MPTEALAATSRACERDQLVGLGSVPWAQYEALLRTLTGRRGVHVAYLDGELEILTASPQHEYLKKFLARLVEAYADVREIDLIGFGQATWKRRAKHAGIEADECYCLRDQKATPDLAIEVVLTSGGLDKLEIYRRLGVGEVWFLIDGRIHLHRLSSSATYARSRRSGVLRGIDLAELERLVASCAPAQQPKALRAFRRSVARPG